MKIKGAFDELRYSLHSSCIPSRENTERRVENCTESSKMMEGNSVEGAQNNSRLYESSKFQSPATLLIETKKRSPGFIIFILDMSRPTTLLRFFSNVFPEF